MIYDFKVNDFANPILVDDIPTFSWKIKSDDENVMQVHYHLTVSTDEGDVLWDTDVDSDESVGVEYAGKPLEAFTRYSCSLLVKDNHGKAYEGRCQFTTGLMGEKWPAKWIGGENINSWNSLPVFKRKYGIKARIKHAYFYVTAHGVYDFMVDDKKVGDAYFAPGWTSYEQRLQYQAYDVTNMLNEGEHELQILVGNGWYKGYLNCDGRNEFYGSRVSASGFLRVEYDDGSIDILPTDDAWSVCDSFILDSEIYHGETQDFTHEKNHDTSVITLDDNGDDYNLVAQESEPVRITERINAAELIHAPNGDLIIDFGQNMAGVVEVKLPAYKGDGKNQLVIKHAETLDKDGNLYTANLRTARATDTYIYRHDMENTWVSPHFTYHGFRYISVEGVDENLLSKEEILSSFVACVMHTDMERIGTFKCDNADVNRLQKNIEYGQRSNFFDIPTDCPQRDERLGWTGDATIFCATAAYNFDTKSFFKKWLRDVAAETDDEHGTPHIVPSIEGKAVGTAVWSDCATVIPWQIYMSYGDKVLLKEHYPLMKKWVEYIYRQCGDGILWMNGFQRGDWLALDAPQSLKGLMSGGTDKNLVANVYYAISTRIVRDAAGELGYDTNCEKYSKRYEAIFNELNEEYVTRRGRLVSETQSACALLLHYGLLREEYIPTVTDTLKSILARHGNHLTTGFVGTAALLPALSENGLHGVAEEVFYQRDYPGWFYAIDKGATTIWERWDSVHEDGTFDESGMNSLNHYSYGSVGQWMYEKVAGISAVLPGYKKSLIRPVVTRGMDMTDASLETPYGRLGCKLECNDGRVILDVEIPANTTAELILPGKGETKQLGSGNYHFEYEDDIALKKSSFSLQTKFDDILGDERTAKVLFAVMPEMKDSPMLGFIKGKTLNDIAMMSPDGATSIDRLVAALNEARK